MLHFFPYRQKGCPGLGMGFTYHVYSGLFVQGPLGGVSNTSIQGVFKSLGSEFPSNGIPDLSSTY